MENKEEKKMVSLDAEEQELIANFRRMGGEVKAAVFSTAERCARAWELAKAELLQQG